MNVQRTKSHIWQVSLATRMTRCIIILGRLLTLSRLSFTFIFLARIKYFIGMHDSWALIKISESLLVFALVYVQYTTIEVKVFFIEYIFLVVVGFIFIFLQSSIIFAEISTLCSVRSSFELMIQPTQFFRIEFTQVFKLIIFVFFLLLLDAEPKIIFLHFSLLYHSVLLLPATHGSYLVSLGPLSTWDHLRVQVLNTRLMRYLCQLLVVLLWNEFSENQTCFFILLLVRTHFTILLRFVSRVKWSDCCEFQCIETFAVSNCYLVRRCGF